MDSQGARIVVRWIHAVIMEKLLNILFVVLI